MNGAELISLGRLEQRLNHKLFSDIKILMETKDKELYRACIRGVSPNEEEKHYIVTWYKAEWHTKDVQKVGYTHGFTDISDLTEYLIKIDKKLASSKRVSENVFKEE